MKLFLVWNFFFEISTTRTLEANRFREKVCHFEKLNIFTIVVNVVEFIYHKKLSTKDKSFLPFIGAFGWKD